MTQAPTSVFSQLRTHRANGVTAHQLSRELHTFEAFILPELEQLKSQGLATTFEKPGLDGKIKTFWRAVR